MSTIFHFVRHGEIPSNIVDTLPRPDESLTEKGRQQAIGSAAALGAVITHPCRMYYSPIPRAAETAVIICDQLKPSGKITDSISDERLVETSFGDMVGMTWKQTTDAFPNEHISKSYVDQTFDFGSHHGGSFDEIKARVYSFINDMKARYPDGEVAVVAHGGVIRCVYKVEQNKTFEKVPANASIHTFVL